MSTISERLGVSNDIIEFKFGKSFTSKRESSKNKSAESADAYHTIRYDFKPVSVDTSKPGTIEFTDKNKVTVTAPNVEGSGMVCTVFQGSKKPNLKECVLVIDHETGEITLEKLTSNIVVKKTRAEGSSRLKNLQQQARPLTPSSMNASKSISPRGTTNSMNNGLSTGNGFGQGSPAPYKPTNRSPSMPSCSALQRTSPPQPSVPVLNSMPTFSSLTAGTSVTANQPAAVSRPTRAYEDDLLGAISSSSSDSSSDSSSSSSDDENDDSSSSDDEPEVQSRPSNGMSTFGNLRPSDALPVRSTLPKPTTMSDSSSSDEMDDSDGDESINNLNNNLINSLNNGLSNVGLSNGASSAVVANPLPFSMPSMPKFSQLNKDLQLSESGSDSD